MCNGPRRRSGRWCWRGPAERGNIAETCRRYGIAPNLYYRWKDEAEQGARAALGGKSAAAVESEKDRHIRQLERSLGRKTLEVEVLKNVVRE